MNKYTRLTKLIKGEDGEENVVCSLYNTNKCLHPIHINCCECKMNTIRLAQLYDFEEQIFSKD